MTTSLKIAVASLVVVGVALPASAETPPLKGTWRVVEEISGDGKVNAKPEPGLYIFTDRHYSIMRVTQPRQPLPEKPTEKDMADAFGPFTANSGTW